MFSCFRPSEPHFSSVAVVQRRCDEEAKKNSLLQQQLELALHKADTTARNLAACDQARLELERLAQDKSAQIHQLIASHAAISRSLEDLLGAHGVDKADSRAPDAENTPEELQGVCLVAASPTASPGKTQELEQVQRAAHTQQRDISEMLKQLDSHMTSSEQRQTQLQSQLAATKASKELIETQAKTQTESFQVERAALESSCASLTELNGELTEQLEQAQAALAAAQGARVLAMEGEHSARAELQAAMDAAAAATRDLAAVTSALTASQEESALLDQQLEGLRAQEAANASKYQEALAASAAALARTADMESHINDLTMRLTEAERACEAHTARVAELSAAHTQLTHEAEDLRKRLGDTQTELKKTATREESLSVALTAAEQSRATLAKEVTSLRERLAQAERELIASQAAAAASATALVAAKRDLVTSKQQLASIAQQHSKTLVTLGGTDEALIAMKAKVQDAQTNAVAAQEDSSLAKNRAAAAAAELALIGEQLRSATIRADSYQALCDTYTSLIASLPALIAPPADTPAAVASGGGRVVGGAGEIEAYRRALLGNGQLSLQIASTPPHILAWLATDTEASGAIRDLSVEVDTNPESWESVALRVMTLACLLTRAGALQKFNIAGSAWGGVSAGMGVAGPFLALLHIACQSAMAPAPTSPLQPMMPPASLQMQVDTQLMGESCVALCAQLLSTGQINLSVGRNSPGLYLYTDHEHLDAWYQAVLQTHATHPAVQHALTSVNLARNNNNNTASPAHSARSAITGAAGGGPGASPTRSMISTSSRGYAGGATAGADGSLYHHAHSVSMRSGVSVCEPAPPAAPMSVAGRSAVPRTPEQQIQQGAGSVYAYSVYSAGGTSVVTPSQNGATQWLDCELGNLGLESHHMAMLMVVLITCPNVRRLHLEGNKIGDAGAVALGLGLPHSSALQDLNLSRNMLTREGVRVLNINTVPALRRLDLSFQGRGQHAMASGPATAFGVVESVVTALKGSAGASDAGLGGVGGEGRGSVCRMDALHEVNLSGLSVSESGVVALLNLLSTSGCCPQLRRLVLPSALPSAALGRLQAAAAGRPSLVLAVQ